MQWEPANLGRLCGAFSRMRKLIVIITTIILTSVVAADSKSTFNLLKNYFPEEIKIVSNKEIQFWNSNLASIFTATNGGEPLADFVFLFHFHTKEFASLSEMLKRESTFKNTAVEEIGIFERNAKFCTNSEITPNCVLDGMILEFVIKICFGRSDEGYFCNDCSGSNECTAL